MLSQSLKFIFYFVLIFNLASCKRFGFHFEDSELAAADEKSCGFVQNSKGARVSWNNQMPVRFWIDSTVPEQYRTAIFSAVEDWNKASGKKLITVSEEIVSSPKWGVDGKNTIYWVNKTEYFSSSKQQAKSLLRWVGTTLSDVDILINAADWTFYITEGEDRNALHLESLLVHELGHALGLAHQTTTKSVMYMSLASMLVRNVPSQAPDLEDLGCEYL